MKLKSNEPFEDMKFPSPEFYEYYKSNQKEIHDNTNATEVKNFIGKYSLIFL